MADVWRIVGREGDVDLRSGDARLTYRPEARLPHFHPVRTPAGRRVSLAVPHDHPWHVGLYFAWKFVNGVNCWEEGGGGAAGESPSAETGPDDSVVVRHRLAWGDAARRPLTEVRTVTAHPARGGAYAVDWHARFRALEDVLLDRTPPPPEVAHGGYAGLSLRLPRAFYDAEPFDGEGRRGADRVHGQAAAWCACAGHVDGEVGGACGAALLEHPDNPRFPGRSFALTGGSIQFLQRAVLWDEPLRLRGGDELTLRYRIVVFDGVPAPATVDGWADAFART